MNAFRKFQKKVMDSKFKTFMIRNSTHPFVLKNNLTKIKKNFFSIKNQNPQIVKKESENFKSPKQKKLIRDGYSENVIGLWLLGTAGLVLFMICLGGYTRLTKSGLSMTNWKPINPKYPSNDDEWNLEFNRYKETPEFIEANSDITIQQFKRIFFIEYFHRSIGRMLGVVFGLPLLYFNYQGYFTKLMKKRLFLFLSLGGLQGLIGWWMVKSGFEKRPDYQSRPRVSTYRLLTHNSMALVLYGSLLYNSIILLSPLKYKISGFALQDIFKMRRWCILLIHLLVLNLTSGVTVAGIDAGKVFNTWPLMNGGFIPNNYWDNKKGFLNIFENCATVQFNHRTFAYLTYFFATLCFLKFRKLHLPFQFAFGLRTLIFLVNFQLFNGVLMLLKQVPVEFGVLHQGNGVLTLSTIIFLLALCSPRMIII